jgi:F-type H+-transporting ATPase subunit delta
LAKSYAQAIYEVAFGKWSSALGEVRDKLQTSPQVVFELTDPKKDDDEKRKLLKPLLPEYAAQEITNVVLSLAHNGHLGMLKQVVDQFEELAAAKEQLTPAIVTTAIPLTDEEVEAMKSKLSSRYGTRLDFQFNVDPAILGGVVVHVAGRVIDDSVAGKLAALRDRLGVTEH